MSRRPLNLSKREIATALGAAIAEGLTVFGYEVDPTTGRIFVDTSGKPKRSEGGETAEDLRKLI